MSPKERLRMALEGFELPQFPGAVNDALKALHEDTLRLEEVGEILAQDPKIGISLLKTVNSAAFALRNPVNSVAHAASLLGSARLESCLIVVGVESALPSKRSPGFRVEQFWSAAQRRAFIAGKLADAAHPQTRGEAVTAALLQDMAIPALVAARREYYKLLKEWSASKTALCVLEKEAMGVDHAEIGGWLCEAWGIPDALRDCIAGHHLGVTDGHPFPSAAVVSVLGMRPARDDFDSLVQAAQEGLGLSPDVTAGILSEAKVSR
ncbi:MAG: HDOD domain-containing protein [Deltaproteobacteria bacterium]|nr:HDOD domain-containing protein [Deltaproteobacteria bacterium]